MPQLETFRIIIHELKPANLPDKWRRKVIESCYFFEDAIKSNFFRDTVLTFNGTDNGFNQRYNLGLNNIGVYLKVINAIEENDNIERFSADLKLNIIRENSPDGRTIGFVQDNTSIIHTYHNFLSLPMPELSSHFAHEWTHFLGFKHPIDTGQNQNYLARTVPYAVGNIVKSYLRQRAVDLGIV